MLTTPTAIGRRGLIAAALGLALGSCTGEQGDDMQITHVESLEDAVLTTWRDGGERPVADAVDVEFDDLLVFPEMAEVSRINEAAGFELLTGTHYPSSTQLFLFRRDGRAVLAAMVAADCFDHEVMNASFGPDVLLSGSGGDRLITLRDGADG